MNEETNGDVRTGYTPRVSRFEGPRVFLLYYNEQVIVILNIYIYIIYLNYDGELHKNSRNNLPKNGNRKSAKNEVAEKSILNNNLS